MFKLRPNFCERLDKLPNSRLFCNAVTKNALIATKEREVKYHNQDLKEAYQVNQKIFKETMTGDKKL